MDRTNESLNTKVDSENLGDLEAQIAILSSKREEIKKTENEKTENEVFGGIERLKIPPEDKNEILRFLKSKESRFYRDNHECFGPDDFIRWLDISRGFGEPKNGENVFRLIADYIKPIFDRLMPIYEEKGGQEKFVETNVDGLKWRLFKQNNLNSTFVLRLVYEKKNESLKNSAFFANTGYRCAEFYR